MIEVELPNGAIAEFPDGTPPEAIKTALAKYKTPQPAPRSGEITGAGGGFLESLLQGATFGLSDEIQAGLQGGYEALTGSGDFSGNYDRILSDLNQQYASYQKENPAADIAGVIAGSIATGKGIADAVSAVPKIGPALESIPALARYALTGGTAGGVAGAASAQPGERAEGAISGAATGAALSPAFAGVARVAESATRPFRSAKTKAERKVAEALERDNLTPVQAEHRAQAMGPGAVLADVGENTRTLADTAAQVPGKTRRVARTELRRRSETQSDRILEPLDRALGSGGKYYDTLDDLANARAEMASPLYERAFNAGVENTPSLLSIFRSPAVQSAWRKAKAQGMDNAVAEGLNFDPKMLGDAQPSLRGWQAVKEQIDDMIGTAYRAGKNKRAKDLRGIQKRILSELDAQNADYANARNLWAGIKSAEGAMERGTKFLTNPMELTAKELRSMSDADKAAFRMGVSRALRDRIERMGDTHNVSKLFNSRMMRNKMRAVFDDNETYTDFINTVRAEGEKQATHAMVTGGSPTMARQAAQEDLAGEVMGGMVMDAATGHPVNAATQATRKGLGAILPGRGLDPKLAEQVGDLTLSTDPAARQQLLARLLANRSAGPQLRLGTALATGGASGLLLGP